VRFRGFLGLIALAGSIAPGMTGQQTVSAAPATAGCTGPFTQVASPSPGTAGNELNATATAGTHGLWAVGEQDTSAGHVRQNLVLFDGGHGWTQVTAPDPGSEVSTLTAVSASGPADAWAAGYYFTNSSAIPFAPQALHWDGSSWTLVPFPVLHHEIDMQSIGIADISPDDAWLVAGQLRGKPIIAHWDGTAWSLVTVPTGVRNLSAVAASGPDDVWAAGIAKAATFTAVILHYNGKTWTKSATLPGFAPVNGLASISRSQAWLVGAAGEASAAAEWNGSGWHAVPTPALSTQDTLYAVSGTVKGGVWAVGSYQDFSRGVGEAQPMALHWDGTAWTAVPATGAAPGGTSGTNGFTGFFRGVAIPTASRVVAVGSGASQGGSLVADLCPFAVRDTGFAPAVASLSGAGAAAYWVFPSSDKASHDLADGTGFNLFDSGAKAPGSTYAFAFPASGTYTVTDKSDGASQKVRVPMELVYNVSGRIRLHWASQAPPPGARFEIQKMAPGSTRFAHLWITTKTVRSFHKALPAGTYKFRSRMRDPATGVTTGWSPTLTVTVS
jgi:hypothetical protein